MQSFILFASPWWVNILFLVPFAAFLIFRKKKLALTHGELFMAGIFGIAFGLVEAAVVVYLRSALGSALTSVPFSSATVTNNGFTFLAVEVFRESATIVMLFAVAWLTARGARERWALFLWMFAFWDAFYYIFLFLIIRWPSSLCTVDILFLIPAPWYAQVWFPLVIDLFTWVAIFLCV